MFVSLRVVGFFFVAQWHWTTRFVSYSGYTKIISLHFRSKTKMKTSALSGLGLHFWFWTKMSGYNFSEPLVAYKSGDSMPYCTTNWWYFFNKRRESILRILPQNYYTTDSYSSSILYFIFLWKVFFGALTVKKIQLNADFYQQETLLFNTN